MPVAEGPAESLALAQLQAGTVPVGSELENVVATAHNGNARGLPNRCDTEEAGAYGRVRSERAGEGAGSSAGQGVLRGGEPLRRGCRCATAWTYRLMAAARADHSGEREPFSLS